MCVSGPPPSLYSSLAYSQISERAISIETEVGGVGASCVRVKGGARGGYEMLSLVCVRPGALDNLVRPRDLARLKQMEFEQGAALIRLGNPW